MDDVGDVRSGSAGGQVGGGAQVHRGARLGYRLHGELCALEHLVRLRVELKARQHLLVSDSAARILVDDLDQLLDRVLAVADDVARRAARRGYQLTVDHQQAMIVSFEEALDDHRARVLPRHLEAVRDLLFGGEANRDTASVVAVVGFRHDREADAACGANRLGVALHQLLLRHRKSEAGQDLVGLLLVAGELDRDVRRATGNGRLDALLVLAVAELHERLVIQTQPRNTAMLSSAHQGGSRWAKRAPLREADELIARLRPLPPGRHAALGLQALRQQGTQQAQAKLPRRNSFIALRVLVDHRVHPRRPGAACLAEGHLFAGDVLQLDGNVLEYMAEPGAFPL